VGSKSSECLICCSSAGPCSRQAGRLVRDSSWKGPSRLTRGNTGSILCHAVQRSGGTNQEMLANPGSIAVNQKIRNRGDKGKSVAEKRKGTHSKENGRSLQVRDSFQFTLRHVVVPQQFLSAFFSGLRLRRRLRTTKGPAITLCSIHKITILDSSFPVSSMNPPAFRQVDRYRYRHKQRPGFSEPAVAP
jgi:hypothetical protein